MRLGCCVIIRNCDGKYLLQFRDGAAPENPLLWDFFGGSREKGETPVECAIREVDEELELKVTPDDLENLGEFEWPGHKDNAILCKKTMEWDDIRLHEGAGCAFFTPEEILQLPSVAYVPGFVERYLM